MTDKASPAVAAPADLVQVGFVSGAYGIAGGIRVRPFSDDADALLSVKTWWLDKPSLHSVTARAPKPHGGDIVTTLAGLSDRDFAESLKGAGVFVPRSAFPQLPENEYYWSDLIGLDVVNLQGEALGRVADMMHNGAQSILRVQPADAALAERLIPFVDQFVKTVDPAARTITVDWGLDF